MFLVRNTPSCVSSVVGAHSEVAATFAASCSNRCEDIRINQRFPKFLPHAAQFTSSSNRIFSRIKAIVSDLDDIELSYSLRPNVQSAGKVGVLLLNLGGPDKIEDVQPFLYNLFADPDIIRLPPNARFLQPLIAKSISILRAPKSAEGYKAIGGGSPLRRITEDQAFALTNALRKKGLADASVYVGMRYWHPYTEEAIQQIKNDGVGRLVILPLYPQFSISTSGSSFRLLESLLKSDSSLRTLKHTVIPSWYQRKGYVSAMVDLMVAELQKFREPNGVEIFFSAHGVPKSYVEEAGDPYKEEMEECVQLIMSELTTRGFTNHHTLAYQSRVGPVEWLKPYTDDSIRELGGSGVKSLLAVPISFVSEHIETLEEIDMEYRELAIESGITQWGRVPALNTNQAFIDDLADAVLEALPYVGQMVGPAENSLVPIGDLDSLMEAFDRERRAVPSPVDMWQWGWTKSAEMWNGRLAMLGILAIVALELSTGQSILKQILELD
ncbi:hypothetical protein CEUSTIGMA_g8668.t1 [Chlamydomonas eustigma]|uniref:Ferrochelatase n=1 Tax=Chlamydomonas eustigma TaxID=1157962 RepID=A0A250XDV4_9CHLO|nr:hypothetical protein CEUSTIGMA_g8668.t1 [Chlamydomonas eustigma]|eukprot:GAX81236.1 hypothetical protein CEUSTIGMA_g8668.t1 [Chlamydomonas eustigma]